MSPDRRQHPLWEWGLVVLLLLVSFWFRTYRLPDVPPGLHHDDTLDILLARKVMGGYIRIYYPENFGHEPLYHWLQALYFAVIGYQYPEVRLLSVGISMAGLALVYVLARRLLGRSVALWTLAWQAVSLWPLFYSRRAIRGVLLPPLAALTGYLFIAGLGEQPKRILGRWGTWILAGISLAACLYTYMGSRVLPLFFLLFVLYLALVERRQIRSHWQGIVLFFVVALVLFLPLGIYLLSHPEERMEQINMPLTALQKGDWRPLLENSGRALGMFTWMGDPHWRQFVANTPVFEPLGAILFYLGMLISLWHWRKFEYAFSLLWLPVALLPGMLSEGAPNFLRPIAAQTVTFILPAVAMAWLLSWLQRHVNRGLGWVGAGGMVVILGLNAWRTYDGYFVQWSNHPDARFAYNATLLDEARYLDKEVGLDSAVLSGHFAADLDPAMVDSILRRPDSVPRWCDIRQSLVYPAGSSTVVLQPDYFPIDPTLFEVLADRQPPFYEHRLSNGTLVFSAYPLSADSLAHRLASAGASLVGWSRATTFPDGLPGDWVALTYPLSFGQKVELLGYEILNGDQANRGDVITLLTYWRPLQAGPAAGITFVHLLGSQGTVISGYDGFGAPPNRWMAGDIVVQVHRFTIPADIGPGVYPVELGWYERDTGTRWPVALPEEGLVDRVLLQPLIIR